ncbi:hypothetical protein BBP40_010804 [Aspergillus hancockii]|nr:hypothetical protein BBP40_010804 [Aspergillus hancockii]
MGRMWQVRVWSRHCGLRRCGMSSIPQTSVKAYDSNLTLPIESRVALVDTQRAGDQVVYEAPLIEDNPPQADTGKGNVTAQYVFANFGTKDDYDDLIQANVNITGKIAVVKSSEFSLAGMLIYPDPQMDGEIIVENGYQAYPDGPARPPSLIERGGLGDGGMEILAVPISYADAIPILSALKGHGPLAADWGDRWQGGGLTSHRVAYNVGPSPENVALNVYNNPDLFVGPLHDVIGTIHGCVFPDEVIVLGNHRDAWGPGAGDGNSGSAALNEVARSLATALEQGGSHYGQ